MENEALKGYVERAKSLEVAIFTQKKFSEEFENYISNNLPRRPVWNEPECPFSKPIRPERVGDDKDVGFLKKLSIILAIAGIILLIVNFFINTGLVFTVSLACFVGCLIAFFNSISLNNKNKIFKQRYEGYEKAVERYNAKRSEWENTVLLEAHEKYASELENYTTTTMSIESLHNKIDQQNKDALELLTEALVQHYGEDVIFPKYRNLVAISVIDEYLMSGRCSRLDGADGAYNLYEMELRQNIIVGQLSKIMSDLEQIKDNQYVLYQEIQSSNDTVIGLLKNMEKAETLSAYYNEITALAAITPKRYYGRIYS